MPLYLVRGMGAGDVKLMAAVGTLVGPGNWLQIFAATAIIGGTVAVGITILKKQFAGTCCNLWFLVREFAHFRLPHRSNSQLDVRNSQALRMPHGVLIAVGAMAFLTATLR
jgi:prepilin peptidase CpaA